MKKLLYTILENSEETSSLLQRLSHEGYNGTVNQTTSLRHIVHENEDDVPMVISLSSLTSNHFIPNTTCYFVLDEIDIEKVSKLIREYTHNFTTTKGALFSIALDSYEGSF